MVTRPKIRLLRYLVPVIIVLALFFCFRRCDNQQKQPLPPRDYADIIREGVLRVATEYNSISFYVDGDTVAGFNYELIQAFGRDKGLRVDISPYMSFEDRLRGLSEDRYDVIAYGILATSKLKDSLLLTSPIVLNKQVLVQRKATVENDSLYIRSQLDLAQKTLHVIKGSPSILRIQNLGNEIGDTIYIKEIEKYGPEQLISLVAHGDIDYAVCDESIAQAAADSLPQIDINTAISFTQFYSWAWLDRFQKEEEYQKIYKKYYDKK